MLVPSDVSFFKRKRYAVTFLTFCGLMLSYILRTNLSIAVVEMTSDKRITMENVTVVKKAEFNWSAVEKGFIISSFSYGYLAAPFGGMLCVMFGGVTIFGLCIALTGVLTILTPFIIRINFFFYIATRVVEGILESLAMVSTAEIFVHWAPPNERSRLTVCAHVGITLGASINYPLSGSIAYFFNWEAVFFGTGILSLIWYCFWVLLIKNRPTEDSLITRTEKLYLMTVTQNSSPEKKKISVPWKSILTSGPVWTLLNDSFCYGWSSSFVLFCLPLYIKDVFDINIFNIGLITSVPLVAGSIVELLGAVLADFLRSRNIISVSSVHKIYVGVSQTLILMSFIIISLWADITESIICFTFIRMCQSLLLTTYVVLPIDMSLRFASSVKGLALTAFSVGTFLNPTVMGFFVTNHKSWSFICDKVVLRRISAYIRLVQNGTHISYFSAHSASAVLLSFRVSVLANCNLGLQNQ